MTPTVLTVLAVLAVLLVVALVRAVRVVPPQHGDVVERLGRHHRVLGPGRHLMVPVLDAVRVRVDLRKRVVEIPAQPVVTADDRLVSVDVLLRLAVVDPARATYEIADVQQAVEQLTVLTLRSVVGSMDRESASTAPGEISQRLLETLRDGTGGWGVAVHRAEVTAIRPAPSADPSPTRPT